MKSYLFLLSLLGDCGGGQFVPRACARGNFHVPVFQCPSCKHTNPHAQPQPTCPGAPQGTRGDEGTLSGEPRVLHTPPGRATNPQDEAASWKLTAQGLWGKGRNYPGEASA